MSDPLVFDLTDNMLIPRSYLFRIRLILNDGGLCVVPSDTCYALVGIPMLKGVGDAIRAVLDRDKTPISVTFGTQKLAERFVVFNRANLQVIDDYAPGPLTIVAALRPDLPDVHAQRLNEALKNPKREIGLRFPDSPTEVQLSSELERPLTTTAILYRNGQPVRSFDDAVDIVTEGAKRGGVTRSICAIRRRDARFAGELSTVVEADVRPGSLGSTYRVYREGDVSERQIRRSLSGLDRYIVRSLDEWD